jgi:hypothetical protein
MLMPPTSNANDIDSRIKKGLRFLTKADVKLIRANVILSKLDGNEDPDGPDDLLKRRKFTVEGRLFVGWMTNGQYGKLSGYTGSKTVFANAVARLILSMRKSLVRAIGDIEEALVIPAKGAKQIASGGTAPTGCCTYGGGQKSDTSQAFCELGLAGMWDSMPCRKRDGS